MDNPEKLTKLDTQKKISSTDTTMLGLHSQTEFTCFELLTKLHIWQKSFGSKTCYRIAYILKRIYEE